MIKIISSNIRFDNPSDGINAWNFRKDLLSKTFTSLSADLICSQEGRIDQLKDLESLLCNYKLEDSHRDWIKERMYPCLYVREISCLRTGDFWLSKTPDVAGSISFNSAFPRLCTWGEFQYETKQFFVFNMHLDHTEESVRIEQAKVAIQEIKKINTNKLPIILVGDYNTGPNSKVHDLLTSSLSLSDPWIKLNQKEESSYHMFKGHFDEGARIDWILISDEFNCEEIKLIKAHKGNVYISDHFPVYAKIKLT